MLKHIDLFLPPRSQYGVLHHFTSKFCEAFQRAGLRCQLLEAQKDNPKPFLDKIFNGRPDCTLSFNGLLPDEEGRFFCDLIKVPHVACLVDSPNHFFSLSKSPNTIITCVDRFSCEFFKGLNCSNVLFMPHGVEREIMPGAEEDRNFDVVMFSSCIDYEGIRNNWKKKYSPQFFRALEEAAEITFSDQETSYVQALVLSLDRNIGKREGIEVDKIDFVEALDELELFIKGKDRVKIVQSVKDAKVDVFGSAGSRNDWKKYLKDCPNITVHDPIPFVQALEIMKQSKIVLNSCTWIKNGAHERIFASLLSGALVVTAENIYMREHFQDGQDIVFYQYNHWDDLNEKVNEYLAEGKSRKRIVERGRDVVLQGHTWDHRAANLIRALNPILEKMASPSLR